mgnify:CR=1 FL=1|jgi:hypothetical protein
MIQRYGSILILILFLLGSVAMATAEGKGNARKGKYLFRKGCRACHVEGGSAKEMSPISYTQAKWKAIFAPESSKKLACAAEWDKRSGKDLNDIFTYMYEHAFDSPSPAKCK